MSRGNDAIAEPFSGNARFEVRREVGSGGFGTVYQVWDREHSQLVALKHLHRSDPVALRRFKQEFRTLANLAHLHLVSLYELHQDDANWFFTMEYVDGATFADWLRPQSTAQPNGASIVMTRPARPGARHERPSPLAEVSDRPTEVGPVDVPMAQAPTSSPSMMARERRLSETTPSGLHVGNVPLVAPLGARPGLILDATAASPGRMSGEPPGVGRVQSSTPSSRRRVGTNNVPLEFAQPFFGIEVPDEATLGLWESTRPTNGQGAPDAERVRGAFRQLVEALAWLHASGHLHRDVKPSNVLVSTQGIVKVLDFGLVTRLFNADQEEAIVGTPAYMAPELCAGMAASPASDWYSVGVMLYLVLTGHLPFTGDLSSVVLAKQALSVRYPSELNAVPRDLEELCVALLARNPVERPDASALLASLGDRRRQPGRWTRTPSTGFVGRRREVAALSALLSGNDGGHDVALVEGLSGLGKSALVEHVLRGIEEHGDSLVLRSRCFERGSVRYRALDGAVDDLAQWLGLMPSFEADLILPPNPVDRQALGRLFPALPGIEVVADAALNVDPGELKRRAFGALRQLFAAAARHKIAQRESIGRDTRAPGITIAIDDAQWADEDSLMPLAELFRGLPAGMVRWVLSYRSDELATSPFLHALHANILPPLQSRLTRIDIGPLDAAEALALAIERLGNATPEQARAIAQEAEGSPLFITELSHLIDHRRLASLADDREDSHRRTGLSDLLAARVLDLPAAARDALELIAVAGEPVPVRLVRAATGADQRDLNRLLQDHLIAARASAGGEMVMSWHDRVRETVSWRLSKVELARRHRTLAEVATAQGGADELFLYTHWREAGIYDKARDHGINAANAAMSAFAFDRAVEIYRSLIALASPLMAGGAGPNQRTLAGYHEALGDALRNAGRGSEAAKAYLAAGAHIGDPAQVRRLEILAAEQYMFAGAFGEGEAVIREVLGRVGLSVAGSVTGAFASFALESLRMRMRGLDFVRREAAQVPSERLALIDTLWSVTIGLSMAQPLASQAFQQRHLRVALEAGEPLRVARALTIESAFSGLQGGNDERRSQALARRTHEVAQTIAHPYPEAFATMADGANHWLRGRWPEARRAMDAAVVVFERDCTGVTWEKDTSRFVSLSALAHEGDFAALATRYEAALVDALERGDLYMEAQLRTRVGPLLDLLAGRPEAARTSINRALGRWTAANYQIVHFWSFINRVSSFLYEGDGRAAWRELLAGTPPLKKSMMTMGQYYRVQFHALVARTALCALETATVHAAHLRERVQATAKRLTKEDMGWSRPKAALYGALANGLGTASTAGLQQAASGFADAGMHGHRLAAEALLAKVQGDTALASKVDDAWRLRGCLDPERFRRIYTGI